MFGLVEIDLDGRIAPTILLDLEDFDAAIAELDARYIAGEAAAHAHVWSVIADGFGSIRRHELPPTTPDCVSIDHRRTAAFAPGELNAYFRAAFDLTADFRICVEAVHCLNDVGAVCTHVTHGVSHEGFEAEWREVDVLTVEGNIVNHCEVFDESDIDAALAKFNELSRQTPRLENAASQMGDRFLANFAAGDWDAMAEILADDYYTDAAVTSWAAESMVEMPRSPACKCKPTSASRTPRRPSLRSAASASPSAVSATRVTIKS